MSDTTSCQAEIKEDQKGVCNGEAFPECNRVCQSPRPCAPIAASSLQKLAQIQNPRNHPAQETTMCSQGYDFCHSKTDAQPPESSEQQYEYLTLALPRKTSHRVQIYGRVRNTPAQFLPLAELFLTMLHEQAIQMVNDESRDVRGRFDTFSLAAIDLVSAMGTHSTELSSNV